MEDIEYIILDELYFVVTFDELQRKTSLPESTLKKELGSLLKKGWLKIVDLETDSEIEDHSVIDRDYKNYNYLASKAGLFAHNSR